MNLTSSDGGGAVSVSAHEERDHLGGVDWSTTVGAAESGGLACTDLVRADDGGIGLSSACWGSAITRSSVSDWSVLVKIIKWKVYWMIIPERPGIVTPLAPVTESMTPWAKTLVAAKAKRRMVDEYCILNLWVIREIKK